LILRDISIESTGKNSLNEAAQVLLDQKTAILETAAATEYK
jgi:hypothetical protein